MNRCKLVDALTAAKAEEARAAARARQRIELAKLVRFRKVCGLDSSASAAVHRQALAPDPFSRGDRFRVVERNLVQ